jgi:hypothetical protein
MSDEELTKCHIGSPARWSRGCCHRGALSRRTDASRPQGNKWVHLFTGQPEHTGTDPTCVDQNAIEALHKL